MRTGSAIAILLLCGCRPAQPGVVADNSAQPAQVGRYAIVHSPHIQRDTILLDTATGRTWQQVVYNDLENHPVGWEPMARSDNVDEVTAFRQNNPPETSRERTNQRQGNELEWEYSNPVGANASAPSAERNSN